MNVESMKIVAYERIQTEKKKLTKFIKHSAFITTFPYHSIRSHPIRSINTLNLCFVSTHFRLRLRHQLARMNANILPARLFGGSVYSRKVRKYLFSAIVADIWDIRYVNYYL